MDTLTVAEHVEERGRVVRVDRNIRLFCVLLALLCVAVAGILFLPRIHEQRKELELVVSEDSFRDMPPSVALPSALLSTFRGLLIHVVWARAEELKEDGKYFELQQLYDWVCDLQPHFPKVWVVAAWNKAYNISVGTYSERERWYWVSSGANLLRDKGIPLNPTTVNLYRELAWIYHHKMGDFMDDRHKAYKMNQAVLMERVLGEPPPGGESEEVIDAFRPIAEAAREIQSLGPLHREEFLLLYLDRDTNQPSMRDAADRLSTLGLEPDAEMLDYFARNDRGGLRLEDLVADDSAAVDERLAGFRSLLADEKLAPALHRLLAAIRAHVLKRDLKLDPQYMLELMEKYGPLDWRSVYSHSLYWSALGSRECEGAAGLDENVELNLHRIIQFSLKDTCRRGRIVLEPDFDDPFKSYLDLLPDYRYADRVHELFLELAERDRDGEDRDEYYKEGPAGRHHRSGHVNFLQTTVRERFLAGRLDKARYYYEYLRENYRHPDGSIQEQYLMTLEKFALRDYFEDIDSYNRGRVLIDGMLTTCFLNLAYDRPHEAGRRLKSAELGYKKYMKDKMLERVSRRRLPPWEAVKAAAFRNFILRYPLPLRMRASTWVLADLKSKLEVYREIKDDLAQLCARNDPPFDPGKAFPAPRGWEDYEPTREKKTIEDTAIEGAVKIEEGSKR